MPSGPPEVRIPRNMAAYYDDEYLPNKGRYPGRPGEFSSRAYTEPHGGTDDIEMKPTGGGGRAENNYEWGTHNYDYDNDDGKSEFDCCPSRDNQSKALRVLAMLLISGLWVAFMFMHIAIFTGIGKTSNWLTCLAYVFLGLPVVCFIFSAVTQLILNFAEVHRYDACTSPVIGIIAMISWFAIGIPLTMLTAQEHALVRYLDPQFQQDRDCYREVQPNYKHGSVHFIFLKDREWEVDEASFQNAKMPYEGNHYFYGAMLRYRGKAAFNCQRPILLTCYHQGSKQSFANIKRKCWNQPPTGVSIRVMNQNEQFYRNWISENDSEAEKFMRDNLLKKYSGSDRHPEPAMVTYNGDNPLDFVEKLDKVRKGRRACLIFTWVWWAIMVVIYFLVMACVR